jgi:hypothetical protein
MNSGSLTFHHASNSLLFHIYTTCDYTHKYILVDMLIYILKYKNVFKYVSIGYHYN